MSKKVHPYAHRLVILRDWKSRWFATDKKYQSFLRADVLMREYLVKKLRGLYIASIEIERSQKSTRLIIKTSRPGMIIGRNGEGAIKLKADLVKFMKKHKITQPEEFKVDILEVSSPDSDAAIVSYMIAESLEKRMPFRRVLKQMVEKVIAVREVKGVRIVVGGRLGGAEMARTEDIKRGNIPLQTFRADIDFARERAHLPYGDIGIKVWIYKGEVFENNDK
ncbi:30S ribosomal protein S3 [Candidatus Wolfebacteria bacterium]|nr:MAG: 30S ribosomal protein S3 [Candidatus Wolfebacteria bacterium]